jgi:hypothetical protein
MRISFASVLGVALGSTLLACSSASTAPAAPPGAGSPVIVAGTVERELPDHAYNKPLTPAPGAHVVLELRRYIGEDADSPTVAQVDLPFTGLPFDYQLRGEASALLAEGHAFTFDAVVYNHPGTDAVVGDLVSETRYDVQALPAALDVRVSGLESCTAPGAGGFCI